MNLTELHDRPYELLLAMEEQARAAAVRREGKHAERGGEWIGVGFRLGTDHFVTDRADVKEVLSVPEFMTRVPGAKSWLRGIANVRGQLITVVDLKAFLGGGISMLDRRSRVLVASSRDVPTGLLVDEVLGFRRFNASDYRSDAITPMIRCEGYIDGSYRRGAEAWPFFRLPKLLADEQFLSAADVVEAQAS
ncbi:MAG: chemotaxis protein CheW [Gammaproteobacteria bacterium]|nr:chemotaxis protein CheW [Gammaproteobacteria bacterium]